MITNKIVANILAAKNLNNIKNKGMAAASSNIALAKYWGKRNNNINLPHTGSLSISLGTKGAETTIELLDSNIDKVILNGQIVARDSNFYRRITGFLDLFRVALNKQYAFLVTTKINIPVAAGVASSACGFAALTLALNDLFDLKLNDLDLSILARLGSGSASRSIFNGFVEWHRGVDDELGMDSYAEKLDSTWPDLRVGLLLFEIAPKEISSRVAMHNSVLTSPFYKVWPQEVENAIKNIKIAIKNKDFDLLGQTAETNSICMHALMQTSTPPTLYSKSETINCMHKIWSLRAQQKLNIYFTQDAGPNLKLLFLKDDEQKVKELFEDVEIVIPFSE